VLQINYRRCLGCGREGSYRDTVIRPLADLPVAGYPLMLRVAVPPRYRCATPAVVDGWCSIRIWQIEGPTSVDDAALRPVCVAAVDNRPHHDLGGPAGVGLPMRGDAK
jgi:hypothetical protein